MTILIGKTRRITIDELATFSNILDDLKLEYIESNDIPETEDDYDATSALSSLPSSTSPDALSTSETLASLALIALVIAQNRVVSDCIATATLSKRIVALANAMKESNNTKALPSDPLSYAQTLSTIISTPLLPPSATTAPSYLKRALSLSIGALSASAARSYSKAADAIAILSAERFSVDVNEWYGEAKFDIMRPHRGCMDSASKIRTALQGSKFAISQSKKGNAAAASSEEEVSEAVKATRMVPQYHGPSKDMIHSNCATLELEMNCSEWNDGVELDDTIACLALQSILNGAVSLLDGSKSRSSTSSGEEGEVQSTVVSDLFSLSQLLSTTVSELKVVLEEEAKIGLNFITAEIEKETIEAKKKEEEKRKRAEAHAAKAGGGDAKADKDEFAGKSEAQIAKILKKRAEKEAKAAAKKAKKGGGTTAGAAGEVIITASSIFGVGTSLISAKLTTNPSLTPDTVSDLTSILENLLSGGIQRKPKIAKGTRDYLPDQMAIRDKAFQIIRRVFKSHGAVEIDTPVFELKDTLTGKYGEDSKLIYDLADQGGELLALRYDLTVPFARFLALNAVGNIKRFHIGKVYRRDQPQLSKGRYREFYQCDFDIAGVYGRMVPDSECVSVACDILDALPIGEFGIKLNHRRLLDAILDICGVPADKFRTICSAVDKLDKEPWSEVKREMVEDKGLESEVADKIGAFVVKKGEPWTLYNELMGNGDASKCAFGTHAGANEAMEDLRILFEYLEAMDKLKFISFDLSLARGLDYYTGVIYEAVCMSGNTQVGSIGGGGRYDNLVSMFQEAGKVTPCVGVSVGIERVFTLMEARLREEQGTIKQPNVNVLVASVGANMMVERMKLARILWDANISAEFSQQENPKLKYELSNALERAIPFMVIVGEDEAKEGKCKVKDLAAKTEETVTREDLVKVLRSKGVVPVGCEFAAELLANED